MSDLLSKSIVLANEAYDRMLCDDKVTPYIVHSINVLNLVMKEFRDELKTYTDSEKEIIFCTCILHDILENCSDLGYDYEYVGKNTNYRIADSVNWLTKKGRPEGSTKDEFTTIFYKHLGKNSPFEIQMIEVCCRLDEINSYLFWNENYKKEYIKDMKNLVFCFKEFPKIHLLENKLKTIKV